MPEAATMLFAGGFPRTDEPEARCYAQRAIFGVQRNLEDLYRSLYPGRALICDRGTIDGAAYWPRDGDFFIAMGTTHEAELARYDAVIFFESAAVGGMSIEGGNRTRIETDVEAVQLDRTLRDLYADHPRFTMVPHQVSFFEKIRMASRRCARSSKPTRTANDEDESASFGAVAAEAAVEGRGADAEALGGALAVAANVGEHGLDVTTLDLGEGELGGERAARARGLELRQVVEAERVALGEDHGALHRVGELTHVAGPVVGPQATRRVRRDGVHLATHARARLPRASPARAARCRRGARAAAGSPSRPP